MGFAIRAVPKPPGIGDSGFFDPATGRPPATVVLRQVVDSGREYFVLERPIGYWDREVGGIVVPADPADFRTDLTSVPALFTWLIPRTGVHLPASLIHDGLVHEPDEPASYVADRPIDRITADRIFRDAMRDAGTSWLRRWLAWTAVTTWGMVGRGPARTWRTVAAVALTAAAVLVGGIAATADLLDCREWLPWMGARAFVPEMLWGLLAAVAVTGVLAPFWGRRWPAGWIAGLALALLVHVTVALVVVSAVFTASDRLAAGRFRQAALWAAVAAGTTAGVLLLLWAVCRPAFLVPFL